MSATAAGSVCEVGTAIGGTSSGVGACVPVVEIADNADRPGMWRPDGETHAFSVLIPANMGTQHVVYVPVTAFAEEMKVEFAERWAVHRPCCS